MHVDTKILRYRDIDPSPPSPPLYGIGEGLACLPAGRGG